MEVAETPPGIVVGGAKNDDVIQINQQKGHTVTQYSVDEQLNSGWGPVESKWPDGTLVETTGGSKGRFLLILGPQGNLSVSLCQVQCA